ncbi:MAG: DUF5615 family PIN-like protein [Chitinophagales bacterium]|jgi:predicted nuclease of predicted toxin-antitoxin system|nr:DUF5615 family PIN-like protein [Sphingobacteriales bacterium]
MKFLLDENISWRMVKLLEQEIGNCVHVSEIFGDNAPLDISIWDYAKSNHLTIITIDNDFRDLSQYHMSLPKVIHLKVHNEPNKRIAQKIIDSKNLIEDFIQMSIFS